MLKPKPKSYFNWLESKGKLPKDEEQMPQHLWQGGEVDLDEPDDDGLNYSPYNSSGEPHTNRKLQEEQNMEYMFDGGVVPGEHGEESYPFARIGAQQPEAGLEDDEDYVPAGSGRSKFAKGGMVKSMFMKALKNRR